VTAGGRGTIDGLASPHPLASGLPGLYREPEIDARTGELRPSMAERLTGAFDELLAPVLSCLDNFDAYLDPALAPPDFLNWLASWVGVELDENWPLSRQREHVLRAAELYRRRGTARGIADAVAVFTGADAEVIDSGGIVWSTSPQTELPGTDEARATVRLRVGDPGDVDRSRVEAIIASAKPAHVVAELEVHSR
jgi:phage tail-like protein